MNATIILSLIVIGLTVAVIITTIVENRKKKPTLDEVTQFCIENNSVLCSKEWVDEAKKALEANKVYQDMSKEDSTWGSSTRALKG